MTQIFLIFIYLSTAIAILATLIVCGSIFVKCLKKDHSSVMDITSIYSQIGICKKTGIIFTVLEWFLFSCEKKEICLKGYANLSGVCLQIGIIWIVFAFICIIINMMVSICKADAKTIANLCRFRNSSFGVGALYILFSFILNV